MKIPKKILDQLPVETRAALKKPNKYRARKTVVDGITFDSKREAQRWGELQLLLKDGQITQLERQFSFVLCSHNGTVICQYVADFTYFMNGNFVVEDAKGVKTAMYKLKKKWMEAEYGIQIREV